MARSKLALGMALVFALGFVACSDDDDDAALNQSTVSSAVQSSVLPVVNSMRAFVTVLPSTKTGLGLEKGDCQPLDICSTGSVEMCPDGSWNWSDCNLLGQLFDGTMTVAYDGTTGSATFNLTIDSVSFNGPLTLSRTGECIDVGYNGFVVSAGGTSGTHNGTVTFCLSELFPAGGSLMSSIAAGSGTFVFDIDFDGSGVVSLNATDAVTGDTLSCSVDLITGTAICL